MPQAFNEASNLRHQLILSELTVHAQNIDFNMARSTISTKVIKFVFTMSYQMNYNIAFLYFPFEFRGLLIPKYGRISW